MDFMIVRADKQGTVPVSHQPEFNKRVIVSKGIVPGLLQCATAQFQAGDVIAPHKHETMTEVFFVVSGNLLLISPTENHSLNEGDCFVVSAGTEHCLEFLSSSKLFYFNLEMP